MFILLSIFISVLHLSAGSLFGNVEIDNKTCEKIAKSFSIHEDLLKNGLATSQSTLTRITQNLQTHLVNLNGNKTDFANSTAQLGLKALVTELIQTGTKLLTDSTGVAENERNLFTTLKELTANLTEINQHQIDLLSSDLAQTRSELTLANSKLNATATELKETKIQLNVTLAKVATIVNDMDRHILTAEETRAKLEAETSRMKTELAQTESKYLQMLERMYLTSQRRMASKRAPRWCESKQMKLWAPTTESHPPLPECPRDLCWVDGLRTSLDNSHWIDHTRRNITALLAGKWRASDPDKVESNRCLAITQNKEFTNIDCRLRKFQAICMPIL